MMGLIDTATVYSVGVTGGYTVVAEPALICRLMHPSLSSTLSAPQRAEFTGFRELVWDGVYQLDEHAQIDVGGTRLNVQAGSVAYLRGPNGAIHHGRADVVRAS